MITYIVERKGKPNLKIKANKVKEIDGRLNFYIKEVVPTIAGLAPVNDLLIASISNYEDFYSGEHEQT